MAVTPPSLGKSPKMGPNEIQTRYREVLSILATGDQEAALEALYDFETWIDRHEELYRKVIAVRHTPDASQSSGGS